ncbi:DnaD domain protein [Mammaliicoccus fleurettii]|uniref:DnaD domain protein n=1 Tax=Mammaliicoccus fleurettii TaxID=150056 RepID=UPI0009944B03|nr:DnaD domain protein [Mammaliicoccus fleurettii]OOV78872.1 DNA replication protein DnaD [Mammaliicoccus fleurettii]
MAIFRVYKESGNFVTVHKNFIHDNTISWKAKGILLYLLSRPDDWQVYETELVKHTSDGLSSLKSGIKELEEVGYIRRTRKRDDKGRLKEYEYSVFEHPNHIRLSNVGKSNVGNSNIGKTYVGESNTTNNDSTYNDSTNNDSTNSDSSSEQQSPFDFYQTNGFGMLKPYISEQIGGWIDDFKENGNEIVIEAMKEALNNNVSTWNYVNSILKSWNHDGVKTVEDISARNKKRSKQEEVADEDNPYLKYMNN